MSEIRVEDVKKFKRERPRMKGEGRVYKYGAREPEQVDLVRDQFHLAHGYRNVLVQVEHERRAAVSAALAELSPELVAVETEIGEKARDADPEKGLLAEPATGLLGEIGQREAELRMDRVKVRGRPAVKDERLVVLRTRLKVLWARRSVLRGDLFGFRCMDHKAKKDDSEERKVELSSASLECSRCKQPNPEWVERQNTIEARDVEKRKAARAASGLYWGTYLQIERAAEAFRKGRPPRFRPWGKRKDKLAVQIQKGLSVADLLTATDSRLRLVEDGQARVGVGEDARPERRCDGCRAKARRTRRGQSEPKKPRPCTCASLPPPSMRHGRHATVWMRGGSDEDRGPVWVKVPVVYHRSLPVAARIKWAYLIRRSVGVHDEWSVQFVLEAPSFARTDLAETGTVGIDVGWRRLKDGALRVAVYAGSDGEEGEVALPAWWVAQQRKVYDLASIRDTGFNAAREPLRDWLRTASLSGFVPAKRSERRSVVELLTEARATLHSWRSCARLAGLVLRWRKERLGLQGEDEVLAPLEAWRKRDRHLLCYEEHLRKQLQGSRRDLYRRTALGLAKKYRVFVIEELDLRVFHELPLVEEGMTAEDDAAKKHARDACLSDLRGAFKVAREVCEVEAALTTMKCHFCGHVQEVGAHLVHTCLGCGLRWDQDVNAARNLIAASSAVMTWTRAPLAPERRWGYGEAGNSTCNRTKPSR